MTLRFLAAAGPAPARRALGHRLAAIEGAGLAVRFEAGPLTVWTPPAVPVLHAAAQTGLAVGRLFEPSGRRIEALRAVAIGAPAPGGAWGPHVLFAARGPAHSVLRDPSGAVPVYHAPAGPLTLYASDAAMLAAGRRGPLAPDLDYIRHFLTYPFLRAARTGAETVSALLPGTGRRADAEGAAVQVHWSPFAFTGRDAAIAGRDEAARQLRTALLRTVPALAGAGGAIVLQLSGGLDSSILAGALRAGGRDFRALTFATRAGDGDERRFARTVADRCGVPLVELVENESRIRLEAHHGDPLRPPPNPLLQPLHRALALQTMQIGADTVVDGAGGDNVFGALHTGAPALDALRRSGVAAALGTLHDVARVHGCDLWTAARSAWRRARRGAAARWPRDETFLATGAAAERRDPHPWLDGPRGLLPGAADHIAMIAGIHHFLADPGPGPETLHPLLAQPVLELCLRIPAWLWVADGRDRSVARAAARGLVPDAILARRGKGTLESLFVKGYRSLRAELVPFLADGALAGRGIIDPAAVRAYLSRDGDPRDTLYVRILEIAAAEQWLRSFGG